MGPSKFLNGEIFYPCNLLAQIHQCRFCYRLQYCLHEFIQFLHTAIQKLAWSQGFRVNGIFMTYIMALILGEENISCSASSTWLIPTNAVPFFFERESAISTALRHISRHRRASPDTAATYEAQMVNINIQILHSNPKRKIKRCRNDKFQSNSFETLQLQRCKMDEIQLFSREDFKWMGSPITRPYSERVFFVWWRCRQAESP